MRSVRPGRNPDLVLAERVVADLVRGAPRAPMLWAVSVVRTAAGPQVYVAGNVAGGSFLPRGVHLPQTARLAATDPALPGNWWAPFMGWPRPVDILAEHYTLLSAAVSGGVALAAVATTDTHKHGRLPAHLRAEFAVVPQNDVGKAAMSSMYQHRLATLDPALYSRLRALRPEIARAAALNITQAIVVAAQEVRDEAGVPMATKADEEHWLKAAQGSVTEDQWATYRSDAGMADLTLGTHATHSFDDDVITQRERAKYQHLFRKARVMELLCCWEQPLAPSLPDIVYNVVHAGYNPAQIIDEAERSQS